MRGMTNLFAVFIVANVIVSAALAMGMCLALYAVISSTESTLIKVCHAVVMFSVWLNWHALSRYITRKAQEVADGTDRQ